MGQGALRRAGLLLLLAASRAEAASGIQVPLEFRDCRDDTDCVAVAEDCCPAGTPRSRAALNRHRLAEYGVFLTSACASGTVCRPVSTRRRSHEARLRPSCENRRCCLVEEPPMDDGTWKDLADQERRDRAWLEGLRASAMAIKEADRALAGKALSKRRKASLKKRRQELLARLDAAAQANMANYLAQTYLGQVFLSIDETERALACASRAAEMAPKDSRTIVLRGLARYKLGHRAAAAADAREALKLDPGDKAALDLQTMTSGPHP
ncbi:MAG: hypothetical protein HZB91_11405 [Elusimicrobia bacterium]|nr:hypothetical protein [Elusimicrobiota bacterium]